MNLLEKVKTAGVIGAGGAGFPTHVKLQSKAEYVQETRIIAPIFHLSIYI